MTSAVSRAGGKLAAAVERFDLRARIAGARALDIGASTGGFTEVMLAAGARHVAAVDVGRGQLHPRLRADARVASLEGADWKTLPLGVLPGPFDFFTVDVSFVAARSMLRGLAFRLRAGAEGVVLIKPQFELPPGAARLEPTEQRRRAVEKVRAKAGPLGFEIVQVADSPVPGKEGTVEVLAHVRFVGRTGKLPAPPKAAAGAAAESDVRPPVQNAIGESGAKKPQKRAARRAAAVSSAAAASRAPAAARAAAAPARADATLAAFAVAAPGLESAVAREVAGLGMANVRAVPGGAEFDATPPELLRANLELRIATRVLARIGDIAAREFSELRRRAGKLPWERFVTPGAPIAVKASTSHCRLYHTGAIGENLAHAVRDRLHDRADEAVPPVAIYARGEHDRFLLSVDSSGELLHRRGWRHDPALAPMRETLAAGLLALAEWDPQTPLVDPMCGAGTVAIEAALLALRRAPGTGRAFACERWPALEGAAAASERQRARAHESAYAPAIHASDRAASALAAARRNAERAHVATAITFALLDLELAPVPPGRGLIIANPPYGRRVGSPRALRPLLLRIGRVARDRFSGWRLALLVPDAKLATATGLRPRATHALTNGGLRVTFAVYDVP
jgi:putative N6-adenine-specific DNA methylase